MLTFDYLGALGASLLFPLVLVPQLGLVRSALLFGLSTPASRCGPRGCCASDLLGARRLLAGVLAVAVLLALGVGWPARSHHSSSPRTNLYADEVILARNTPYQRIVLTAWKDDLRLFLNSHLQFSSRDEYRYHEALVHPGLVGAPAARRVLVLGGGDGLAVREILKHPRSSTSRWSISIPEMTRLFSTHPELARLNDGALVDPRVHVVNADAFVWLDETPRPVRLRRRRLPGSVRTSRSASSTRRRSTGAAGAPPRARRAASSCRARRRCSRASRSGASSRRSKQAGLTDVAVSRLRAVVRRVGLRARRPDAVRVCRRRCRRICAS